MNELSFKININSSNRSIVSIDNFTVSPNEITFLFGESGIGKSMISKAIYGLLDPDELSIDINGHPYYKYLKSPWTHEIKKNSFFVFQEPSSHLNPLEKISDQLYDGSLKQCRDEKEILQYLWRSAEDEDIKDILSVYPKPYRPSGGEKQRILLAMAFKKINILLKSQSIDVPTYFVFDEPTGSLDNNYRNLFLNLLFRKYILKPFSIVIITHDYSIISEIYERYANILKRIHFKELTRQKNNSVSLRDFSAEEYLSWLHNSKHSTTLSLDDNRVLQFKSDFAIFDRKLKLFKDPSHTRPTDLIINKGEMVYIKAASGVGKTTLAKIIMGLLKAQEVTMKIGNTMITEKSVKKIWQKKIWGKKAGMIFQHADEALNLQATVKETFGGLPIKKLSTDTLKSKLSELFEGKIVKSFLDKKVALLSGGQKQRLNILRTLIMKTDLIILDEPLNGLDFNSITKVLALLDEKQKQGAALLMISHNEEIFENLVDAKNIYYLTQIG